MKLNLKQKFTLISIFSCLVSFLMFFVIMNTTKLSKDNINTQKEIGLIMQRHMECDMMHDAMKSDLLSIIIAAKDNSSFEDIKKDLVEHYTTFKNNLTENHQHSIIIDSISNEIKELSMHLDSYYNQVNNVIKDIENKVSYTDNLNKFYSEFENMEKFNSDLSEHLINWANNLEQTSNKALNIEIYILTILSIITLALAITNPFYAIRTIFNPIEKLIVLMNKLADEDTNITIQGLEREDEIGEIANALEILKDATIKKHELEKHKEADVEKKLLVQEKIKQFITQFEEQSKRTVEIVFGAANKLFTTAEQMTNIVAQTSQKSLNSVDNTKSASDNVKSVATASEQLSISVNEIANQLSNTTKVINESVNKANNADRTSESLANATDQINNVVEMIKTIADNINLLALNATIESARAGEAGKGFAVVASEIKSLASQTTKATDEITSLIESVQKVSEEVVSVLQSIKGGIVNIEQYNNGISSAIVEQQTVSSEIAANMSNAASNVENINRDINEVNSLFKNANQNSQDVLHASKVLFKEAENLKKDINLFLENIRNLN